MNKDYLPSKQFLSRVIILVLFFGIGFLISKISPELKDKINQRKELRGLSVREFVANDANDNGIADWEESLFGLDPKGNGEENKQIILARKKELGTDESREKDANLSENDKLSRELFSIITTLDQTGNLNEASINNIANALDERLNSEPILDVYSKDMIKSSPTNTKILEEYYNNFGGIAVKYKDSEIGDELIYISQALSKNDSKAMDIARDIARKYKEFGEDLMKIEKIPSSLMDTHLSLANNYHKTSLAIQRMSIMLEDPLFGMNAVADYKNFTDEIIKNLNSMSIFFEKNVIIER